jgi:hypothetical protein
MRTLLIRCVSPIVCGALLIAAAPLLCAQIFTNPPLIRTNTDPVTVAAGDLNLDGKQDLVYIDGFRFGANAMHVLLGNGNGTFTHGQDMGLPKGICCSLQIADVTNDGKPDLILGGGNASSGAGLIAVYVGNGDGTFQPPIVSTIPSPSLGANLSFATGAAIGDINGDGKPDLVSLSSGLTTLLGDGAGHFTLNSSTPFYASGSAYLADLNGDHKLDLILTDPMGAEFFVELGNGDGTFAPYVRYTIGSPGGPLPPVDVDGDGHLDMLVTYYPGQLGYFKGNADGSFSPLIPLGASPSTGQPVVAADLNGDGIPDLAFMTPSGVAISLGQHGPAFGATVTTIAGGSTNTYTTLPNTPAPGDFNGDGHADLAVAVEGGISLLFGKGDGTFSSVEFYDLGQTVGSVAVADFTGDKLPDIAVTLTAPFPRVLVGNGQGGFTLGPDPNSSYGSQAADPNAAAADFNGDGKMDLDLGNEPPNFSGGGTQSIAFGKGNGTFQAPIAIPGASPIIADVNGDGRADMISVNGLTVTVLLGLSNGTFETVTTNLRDAATVFGVGDVNKDGKPDLVVSYPDHLEIWLGNGNGSFSYFSSVATLGLANSPIAAVTDVDGDGNSDILVVVDTSVLPAFAYLTIFYGNGDGTFQPPVTLPTSHQYTQAVVVDLNRDHLPDLVLSDGATVATMMNLGGRKFDSEAFYIAGRTVSWLSVVDVNGDGLPDVVAGNPGGTTVTVLLNQPNGASAEGAATLGTLAFAPQPAIAGQPITITLTVAGSGSGPTPTGSAEFDVDGNVLGTAPLAGGIANFVSSEALNPGQHTVVATYSGDSTYAAKSFSAFLNIIPPTYTTQTALVATPASVLASQTIHLAATVSSTPPVPQGMVTFLDGTSTIGSASLDSNSIATYDTNLLAPGIHSLTAAFHGYVQPGFTGTGTSYPLAIFTLSTSPPASVMVTANATATTVLPSSQTPTPGSVVTFTANASSGTGIPFGGITFYDGATMLGTVGMNSSGSARFSTASLATGMHSVTAAFNANGPFAGSVSTPAVITVSPALASAVVPVVALSPQTNPSDGTHTLTAQVSSQQAGPRGTVTFLDSGMILGTAATNGNGVATLRTGALAGGIHDFSASFAGGGQFAPGVSPAFRDQWFASGPEFSLNIEASSVDLPPAASAPVPVAVVPVGEFAQTVQLACASGVPDGYVCRFSPAALKGGGNSTLTIEPAAAVGLTESLRKILTYSITAGLGVLVLLAGLRRRRLPVFARIIAYSAVGLLFGCGPMHFSETPSKIAVLTIRATSSVAPTTVIHGTQISVRFHSSPATDDRGTTKP